MTSIIAWTLKMISPFVIAFGFSAENPNLNLEVQSYGEIYQVLEFAPNQGCWDFTLVYGASVGIPQYTLHSLRGGIDYWWTEALLTGLKITGSAARETSLQKTLEDTLALQGTTLDFHHPVFGGDLSVSISPLDGLVNLFTKKVIGLDWLFGAGPSFNIYDEGTGALGFHLATEQRIRFSESWGFSLGYLHRWEKIPASWLDRGDLTLGLLFQL